MLGRVRTAICATLLMARLGLAPEHAEAQAVMVPQTTDRGEPSCGFKGVPQIEMGKVYFRKTEGAGYKVLSTRDNKSSLQLYFHRRTANTPTGAVSTNAVLASVEFRIDYPRRNSQEFKSFAIFIDGAPAGIQTVGVHNYFGESIAALLSDDATRLVFFKSLQTARIVTFTTSDASGRELTRDSYDVSSFANAFRLLDGSGFRCNYGLDIQRLVVTSATQNISSILPRQPLELDYEGTLAPIRSVAAEDCGLRFDLGDKQLSLPYFDFGTAHVQSNSALAYLAYGDRSQFRIFAAGTKDRALAPTAKPTSPQPGSLSALFGTGGQRPSLEPSAKDIQALAHQLNQIIEMCAPKARSGS